MALHFLPFFEHIEALILQAGFVVFKLFRYSNISRVLPESGVPYIDVLISMVVFALL